MAWPDYKVYIDWDKNGFASGLYDDVSCDLRGTITINRGVSDVLTGLFVDNATFTLDDSDGNVNYHPSTTGVLAGKIKSGLPIAIFVEYPIPASKYMLFIGVTKNFSPSPDRIVPTVEVTAIGYQEQYNKIELSKVANKDNFADSVLNLIRVKAGLSSGDWDYSDFNTNSFGQFDVQKEYIARPFMDLLHEFVTAEHGYHYVGFSGTFPSVTPKLFVHSRYFGEGKDSGGSLKSPSAYLGGVSGEGSNLFDRPTKFDYEIDKVYNIILADNERGIPWPKEDAASKTAYGDRPLSLGNGTLASFKPDQIEKYASYFLSFWKDLYYMSDLYLTFVFPTQFSLNLGNVVRVTSSQLEISSKDFVVFGIIHNINIKNNEITSTYKLRERRSGSLTAGTVWGQGTQAFDMYQLENGFDVAGLYFSQGQSFYINTNKLDVLTEMSFDIETVTPPENGVKLAIYNISDVKQFETEGISLPPPGERKIVKISMPEYKELGAVQYKARIEWLADEQGTQHVPAYTIRGGEDVNTRIQGYGMGWPIGRKYGPVGYQYYKVKIKGRSSVSGQPISFTLFYDQVWQDLINPMNPITAIMYEEGVLKAITNNYSPGTGVYEKTWDIVYGDLTEGKEYEIILDIPVGYAASYLNYYTVQGRYSLDAIGNNICKLFTYENDWQSIPEDFFLDGTYSNTPTPGGLPIGNGGHKAAGQFLNIGGQVNIPAISFKIDSWSTILPSPIEYDFRIYNIDPLGLVHPDTDTSLAMKSGLYSVVSPNEYSVKFDAIPVNVGGDICICLLTEYVNSNYLQVKYTTIAKLGDRLESSEFRRVVYSSGTWINYVSQEGTCFNRVWLKGQYLINHEMKIARGGHLKVYGDPNFYNGSNRLTQYMSGGSIINNDFVGLNQDLNFGYKTR